MTAQAPTASTAVSLAIAKAERCSRIVHVWSGRMVWQGLFDA
ncbi:hypothetical protein BPSOL_1408 [Bifidobacterium pseudolongum]|nr:hypothetical protein BPSOL_1408 [Bifidobacterium pseudolongum]